MQVEWKLSELQRIHTALGFYTPKVSTSKRILERSIVEGGGAASIQNREDPGRPRTFSR